MQRMSVEQYREAIAATEKRKDAKTSGRFRMGESARNIDSSKATKTSAQKARERVSETVGSLEGAITEVDVKLLDDGRQRVLIKIIGGETLPPNRVTNIVRETSNVSQRVFSRYKRACAERMHDAAILIQANIAKIGLRRFNSDCKKVVVSYGRQVTSGRKCIDEDAVQYSFKYILDGLVHAGVLVDDSRKYVAMGQHVQIVGDRAILLIELMQAN